MSFSVLHIRFTGTVRFFGFEQKITGLVESLNRFEAFGIMVNIAVHPGGKPISGIR